MTADYHADVSPVVEKLRDVHHTVGYSLGRCFRDWMELAVFAFERNDEEYLDRLDRYDRDGPEGAKRVAAETYSEALGELVVLTAEADRPVVGDVYEQVGYQSDDFGQFFTPWNVSVFLAQMAVEPSDIEAATPEDPLTVADPACGSGRLLVAFAKTVHDTAPGTPVWVRGTDKDRVCAHMAVVNLVIAGVPGVIRYGDSLSLDIYDAWEVDPSSAGPVVRRLDPEAVTPDPDADEESEADQTLTADQDLDLETADVTTDDIDDTVVAELTEWLDG